MKLGFRRGEKGFTLVEIIIVLAVISILAAIAVPAVGGYIRQGKERAWKADRDILQAAVDAWRTDIDNRVGNLWPTIDTDNGDPGDGNDDGKFDHASDNNTFIDVSALVTGGFLKSTDTVRSFINDSTNMETTNTNDPSGSYGWYIDSNGNVQSWYPADDTLGSSGVDIDSGEKGFQDDIYP
jgi:prepilin-type N-terminal cleavage/methylation domain-containing protein